MTDKRIEPLQRRSDAQDMSLRDWFAGMAIMGMASDFPNDEDKARNAYQLADAMLKEREK